MSITSALFTGVSGLINNGEAMNVIGNNLANVNTIGFKGGRTLFSDMLSSNIGNNSQIGRGMQFQGVDNQFTQGSLESSENVSDVMIQGESFFVLGNQPVTTTTGFTAPTDADGALFTRAGSFRLIADTGNANTYILVNPDNYPVLDSARALISVNNANPVKISKIGTDGTITFADSTTGSTVGGTPRIGTLGIGNKASLEKVGCTLFKPTANTFQTAPAAFTTVSGSAEKVLSNSLEMSNVDLASQFVKMIITQRAYSANSKTITTTDEMMQEVLNLKR